MADQKTFSSAQRNEKLEKLEKTEFDVLIVGGGITGAGIALDCASRGLKVALVEKSDFAHGTSSRSTKLVHGGLRYLKQFELGLVREVGHERENLHKNARHIVIPEKMLLPIIKGGSLGKFGTLIGLTVYDFLAGVKKEERKRMFDKKKTLEIEPLLNQELLKGGALYYEYKTSDSRLTIETAKSANERGAMLLNYAEAINFLYRNNKITGAEVYDRISQKKFSIYAKYVINAAGPWVDKLRKTDEPYGFSQKRHDRKKLHLTKGVHLVVSKDKFKINHANYFDVDDGRMIFVIPRNEKVYIGTTDTNYYDNTDLPLVHQDDANYLLNAVNKLFPMVNLQLEDIETAWAGLRPLIHEEGKAPSELSRKDEIFISDSGLISIAGGKLTGYRIMSRKVTNMIMLKLRKHFRYNYMRCKTKKIKLSGGEFPDNLSNIAFEEIRDHYYDEAKQTGIESGEFYKLFYRYGTNISMITEKAYELKPVLKDSQKAWLEAELWYSINYEMTHNLKDFFIRRTEMLFFDKDKCISLIDSVAEIMQKYMRWTKTRKQDEIEKFKKNLSFIMK